MIKNFPILTLIKEKNTTKKTNEVLIVLCRCAYVRTYVRFFPFCSEMGVYSSLLPEITVNNTTSGYGKMSKDARLMSGTYLIRCWESNDATVKVNYSSIT